MKYLLSALLCLCTFISTAQDIKYEMSEPIDIPNDDGWNSVVVLPDGNTLLFHFKKAKGIVVKAFDGTRKEIASKKHICNILDINELSFGQIHGIYVINGEAVLFVTQQIENKTTLLRLRFNSKAELVKEEKLMQSENFYKKTSTLVRKLPTSDDYYIVAISGKAGYEEKQISLKIYGGDHQLKKDIPLTFEQKGYSDITLEVAYLNKEADMLVAFTMEKDKPSGNVPERYMQLFYVPNGSSNFIPKLTQIPLNFELTGVADFNPLTKSTTLIATSYEDAETKHGIKYRYQHKAALTLSADLNNAELVLISNKKIKDIIATELDSNQILDAHISKMHTNNYGLTTIVYSGNIKNKNKIGLKTGKAMDYIQSIAVLQLNEKNEELYGALIPISHIGLGTHGFRVLPAKNDIIVLYNEVPKYMNRQIANSSDTVFHEDNAHTVLCRINRKKDLTRTYLFGQPKENEKPFQVLYNHDFDDRTNRFASIVVQENSKNNKVYKIAWVQL